MGQAECIYGIREVYSGLAVSIFPKPGEYIALSDRVYLFIKRSIFLYHSEYIYIISEGYFHVT